ncbi:2-succinyl-5-enolpyruvyl-6-hydroxy-3-cyclohexene-1-carboxylic-acid synthase (plasmid) [Aggregatilineales bacterium SYSU G02658]
MANRNTLYSQTLVDELARSGLEHVVIAPGSRNTPLVLAFAEHPRVQVWSVLDERSAAFMALGLALATDRPVAMLCTSGSAAANFFPALVEAKQSRVPLIVLTADRPGELRHSGANQTIDQVKLFGGYALWSVDLLLPEADMPADAFRSLRTTANRAYAVANGIPKGVVHLNVPFRKPLEPTPVPSDRTTPPEDAAPRPLNAPAATIAYGTLALNTMQLDLIANLIDTYERGIIVCGPNTPAHARASIARLSVQTRYPLFADVASGLRFGRGEVIAAYDTFLSVGAPLPEPPDVVIRFGDVPTSQPLNDYLNRIRPAYRLHLSGDGVWADDSHRTTHFFVADEKLACMQLYSRFENRPASAWAERWHALERATQGALAAALADVERFDGHIAHEIAPALPDGAALFVGSSLPIRNMDQFAGPTDADLQVFANRGASGIDGNVSTAVGVAAAERGRPVVALLGDLTLYHDMNGLMALRRLNVPLTLVVVNNDGGGIFHRLPIRDYEPTFTDLFITPHGLTFEHAAAMYGLRYARCENTAGWQSALTESLSARAPTLIEIVTDGKADLARRKALMEQVKSALAQGAW